MNSLNIGVDNKLLFIHVMKTGGTSFRRMLAENIGKENLFPNDIDLSKLPNGWYPSTDWISKNIDETRSHKILVGHYPFSLSETLGDSYIPITFLREPFKRTISIIGHRKRKSDNFQNMSYEQLLDHHDFVERQIRNYQTKVFSMRTGEVNSSQENCVFDIAIERLNKCEFIGLNEFFESSCFLFDKMYGSNLKANIRNDNVNQRNVILTKELKEKIKPLIKYDIIFYDEAVKIFKTRMKKFGIKF